jgi:protoporphyrinogen oxidase
MKETETTLKQVVIIGAGPAGLTAAYELTRLNVPVVVLEKGDQVGGLSRTNTYKGYYFDMGGHRFFTKSSEVQAMWQEVLGGDFLRRPRLSRIYYKNKFFHYPLKPGNVVHGLGLAESAFVLLSYLRWQLFPHQNEETFEQWVTNRFGKRLFLTFFKTYTEKVWGISCSELKAEWAAQRIKNLSVKTILLSMIIKPQKSITTLIEAFDYPRLGPGMMWEALCARVQAHEGRVLLNSDVVRINRERDRILSVTILRDGREETFSGTDFISSMPITELIRKLEPPAPPDVLRSAGKLTYRDFLTVCLIVNQRNLFPDNWIYVHDPAVKVGRIQNFKNWSPDMVPDPDKSSLGLEYFCTQGDEIWTTSDAELIALAKREVEQIGLVSAADVEDGCVVRVEKAYPVYDTDYADYLAQVRNYVSGLQNLQTIGRNGLHRYNNQDHAVLTGMYAVANLFDGNQRDLWSINTDQEYHEEIRKPAPPPIQSVPVVVSEPA